MNWYTDLLGTTAQNRSLPSISQHQRQCWMIFASCAWQLNSCMWPRLDVHVPADWVYNSSLCAEYTVFDRGAGSGRHGILLVVKDVFVGIAVAWSGPELQRGKSLLELEYDASVYGGPQWRSSKSMYDTIKQRMRIAFEAHRRSIQAEEKVPSDFTGFACYLCHGCISEASTVMTRVAVKTSPSHVSMCEKQVFLRHGSRKLHYLNRLWCCNARNRSFHTNASNDCEYLMALAS